MGVYPSGGSAGSGIAIGAHTFIPWLLAPNVYGSTIANAHTTYSTGLNTLVTSFPWFSGPTSITIGSIENYVATAYGAGSILRTGIYLPNNQQLPFVFTFNQPYATLLQEIGTISLVPTGKQMLSALGIVIPSNTWFLFAAVEQVAVGGTRYVGAQTAGSPSPWAQSNSPGGYFSYQAVGLTMTGQSGALPTTLTPTGNAATDAGVAFSRAA